MLVNKGPHVVEHNFLNEVLEALKDEHETIIYSQLFDVKILQTRNTKHISVLDDMYMMNTIGRFFTISWVDCGWNIMLIYNHLRSILPH